MILIPFLVEQSCAGSTLFHFQQGLRRAGRYSNLLYAGVRPAEEICSSNQTVFDS
jgi:hypothetical protein